MAVACMEAAGRRDDYGTDSNWQGCGFGSACEKVVGVESLRRPQIEDSNETEKT